MKSQSRNHARSSHDAPRRRPGGRSTRAWRFAACLALSTLVALAAPACQDGADHESPGTPERDEARLQTEGGAPEEEHAAATAEEAGEVGQMDFGAPPRTMKIAAGSGAMDATSVVEPTPSRDEFEDYGVNAWTETAEDNLSTFAVDVDTASYTIARRILSEGRLPPAASVRVEEFVNYFRYAYAPPAADSETPFDVHLGASHSPFDERSHLVRVGVQGQALDDVIRKRAHLTFLVDVSGSMSSADKLGLAKKALSLLVDQLGEDDTVSLVTYAGNTRVVLEPTPADQRIRILAALEDLRSGGSTAMAGGIDLAYEQALSSFEEGAINRVIVISDGDANVGPSSHGEILESIQQYVDQGITLSTIGVGMGNYKDTTMEQLANKGNGNNYYFDSVDQAKRVFVEQLGGTLQVIAKDVKIQVEFDADAVGEYRLIGYENRDVADEDFRDDEVDAGEIGAGHSVTALYEVRLQDGVQPDQTVAGVRIRHKAPEGDTASENLWTLKAAALDATFDEADADMRFAVAVATFAEKLRESPHVRDVSLGQVAEIARGAIAQDEDREEFVGLVERADGIM